MTISSFASTEYTRIHETIGKNIFYSSMEIFCMIFSRYFVLLFLVSLVSSCDSSDGIPRRTSALKLNNKTEIVRTTLMRQERGRDDTFYVPAEKYQFPSAFYVFEDNLDGEKQTAIGLLVDTRTFSPLTLKISSENRIGSKNTLYSFFKKRQYIDNGLFIVLTGQRRAFVKNGCGENRYGVSVKRSSVENYCIDVGVDQKYIDRYPCLDELKKVPIKISCDTNFGTCTAYFLVRTAFVQFTVKSSKACDIGTLYRRTTDLIISHSYQ